MVDAPNRDRRLGEIVRRQAGVFHVDQARECGFPASTTRTRVARGAWERRHRGVYALAGLAWDWHREAWAAVLAAGGEAALARRSAVAQHGGLGPVRPTLPIEIVTHYDRAPMIPGSSVVVHRSRTLERCDLTVVDDLPCTTLTRAVWDMAIDTPMWPLREVLADGLRKKLFTRLEILEHAARAGRIPNRTRIPRILAELDPATERTRSGRELQFVELVTRAGLPRPEVNHPIATPGGVVVCEIDAAYPDRRVGFEIDGWIWHSTPGQQVKAANRDQVLKLRYGWDIHHIPVRMLDRNPNLVVERVRQALAARNTPPRPVV